MGALFSSIHFLLFDLGVEVTRGGRDEGTTGSAEDGRFLPQTPQKRSFGPKIVLHSHAFLFDTTATTSWPHLEQKRSSERKLEPHFVQNFGASFLLTGGGGEG